MRLHERTRMVQEAHLEAQEALADIWKKYDLSYGETTMFYGQQLSRDAKWMIREERHPDDPAAPGDEA